MLYSMPTNEHEMEQLLAFFTDKRRLTYKKGDAIVRAEDPPGGIFYVEDGFVKAYAITKYGEENLLIIRHKGDIFPLIWAFTDTHREIFYEAMDEVTVWRCSRDELLEFLDKNPNCYKAMLDLAIEAYRVHAERVNTLEYRTVRERIVSFLLFLAHHYGKPVATGTMLAIPIRRQDIAASINATRETTSRELNALTKKGLIDQDARIILRDLKKLESFL